MHGSLTTIPFASVVLIAYATILTAELVGDKAIYTISALALRFPITTVVAGMASAFAAKMLVAVLLGRLIMRIPSAWIAAVSAIAFFTSAIVIWSGETPSPTSSGVVRGATSTRGWATCFLSLFLPEWGDPGQVAAAALAAQSRSALAPWLGGTLALATKGALAVAIGVSLKDRLPRNRLRLFASASCCALGVVALASLVVGD